MMKLVQDSFFGRLLMALMVYAALVMLWAHSPAPSSAPPTSHAALMRN